jgi:hypothetical protein
VHLLLYRKLISLDFEQTVNTLMFRKGSHSNVVVFPKNDYNSSAFGSSNGKYTLTHSAFGADLLRSSWNFGKNWSAWRNWEDLTTIAPLSFDLQGTSGKVNISWCNVSFFRVYRISLWHAHNEFRLE